MKAFWDGFFKAADVSKEELKFVLKKHEERETPEQEKAESEKEEEIERRADVEKHAFWRGLFKSAEDPEKKMSPAVAAAAVGGAAAAKDVHADYRLNKKINSSKKTKNWKEFVRTLKPGDVVVSGRVVKPNFIQRAVTYLGGSKEIHGQIYAGKGKIVHTPGGKVPITLDSAKYQLSRKNNLVAYRPKGGGGSKAVRRAKEILGSKYETKKEIAKRVLGMVAGVGGGKSCSLSGKGKNVVCTDIVGKAHPQLGLNRYTPMRKIQLHKGMIPVSHLHRGSAVRDTVLLKGLRPAVAAAKWGLPAYGAAKMIEKFRNKKENK